jgi:hypothetical protein
LDDSIALLQRRLGQGAAGPLGPSPVESLTQPEDPVQRLDEPNVAIDENPGIFGKLMGRLFGTDVDDPLPWTRMGTTIGGGVGLGLAATGVPGPPIVKGAAGVMGSIVGTGLGAIAPETTMELLEATGMMEPGSRDKLGLSNEKLATVLEGEVLLDIATLGGVSTARALGRGVTGVLTGSNVGSRELAEAATREGIAILPVQVGNGTYARSFVSVMGRFPWVAGALKARSERAMGQISRAFDGIPQRLGPLASFDEVSGNILREAGETSANIGNHFQAEFTDLLRRADFMGVTVRPVHTRTATDTLAKQLIQETPQALGGGRLATTKASEDLRKFIRSTTRQLTDINPQTGLSGTQIADQSLRRMDTLLQTIDEKMVQYAGSGDARTLGRLDRLRQAVQMDMLTNATERGGTSTPQSRAIIAEFRNLDDTLRDTVMQVLQSTSARRMGMTASPTLRSAQLTDLGTRGMDGLAKVILRGDSPAMVNELGRLVRPETMRSLAGAVMNEAVQRSTITEANNVRRFDVDEFAKQIGLNDPRSGKYLQTQALLQRAGGLTMDQVGNLVEVARRASTAEIPDVSTFVARRATMGGIKSLINTVRPWAIVGTAGAATPGYVGAIITIGGSRMLANMISDPRSARALRTVLAPEARRAVKAAAVLRGGAYAIHNMLGDGTITQEQAENLSYNFNTFISELDKAMSME